jgi:hypothetical protein
MSSFGINKHAHVDAGVFAIFFTVLTYIIKWICGLKFPGSIFGLPTFMAIFIGFYMVLFLVFLLAWNRR